MGPAMTDALGRSGNDVCKKALMFSVIVREKSADGINFSVLCLEKGFQVLIWACVLVEIAHAGMNFLVIGMDYVYGSNISIKADFR